MNADERLAKLDADHAAGYLSNAQHQRMRGLIEANPDFTPGVTSTKGSRRSGAIRRKHQAQPGSRNDAALTGRRRKQARNRQPTAGKLSDRDLGRITTVEPGTGFNLPTISSTRKPPAA